MLSNTANNCSPGEIIYDAIVTPLPRARLYKFWDKRRVKMCQSQDRENVPRYTWRGCLRDFVDVARFGKHRGHAPRSSLCSFLRDCVTWIQFLLSEKEKEKRNVTFAIYTVPIFITPIAYNVCVNDICRLTHSRGNMNFATKVRRVRLSSRKVCGTSAP